MNARRKNGDLVQDDRDVPPLGTPAAGTQTAGRSDVPVDAALSVLSDELHQIYDGVADKPLPIYFGPLLGELYLQGL